MRRLQTKMAEKRVIMPFKDREMRLFFDGGGLFSFSLVHYYTMHHESKMVVTEANDKVMAVNVL